METSASIGHPSTSSSGGGGDYSSSTASGSGGAMGSTGGVDITPRRDTIVDSSFSRGDADPTVVSCMWSLSQTASVDLFARNARRS